MTPRPRSVSEWLPGTGDRFWQRVQMGDLFACWLWTGRRTHNGYGEFTYGTADGVTRHIRAHRAAYELHHGQIDPRNPIDHTCASRLCVNPAHLQAVTSAVNCARMMRRSSDGQSVNVPDAVWDAAESAATLRGETLEVAISRLLRGYARRR